MKNQNKHPLLGIPAQACEACGFSETDMMELHGSEGALVVIKSKMTALELANAINTISLIASELTVALATACGRCDNCGDENLKTCADCSGSAACAQLNGCKDTPVDWVKNCSICRDLMDESQKIQIPDYVLEDAGIPKDAKLEAFADDEGEIVVTEAEYQKDINDVSPGIISVLVASGICLGSLDELIMQEEIIYGA